MCINEDCKNTFDANQNDDMEDYNINNVQNIFEKNMMDIYLRVIFNWNTISKNEHIMKVLNMNTNNICKKIKNNNRNMRDSFVQAYVFSILIIMIFAVSVPIENITKSIPDFILNDNSDIGNNNNDDNHNLILDVD